MLESKNLQSKCRSNNSRSFTTDRTAGGFTLVEIVVSLAILSVTIVAVFGALRMCSRAAYHARMLTKSVLLAESLIVEKRISENTAYETTEGQDGSYRWTVQVAPTPVESLGAIVVRVQWAEQQRPQQYELVSMIQMRSFTERQ